MVSAYWKELGTGSCSIMGSVNGNDPVKKGEQGVRKMRGVC